MSVKLSAKSADFVTTKEAAALSRYSASYLARLAKAGKIAGKQDGKRWLISLDSLNQFASSADKKSASSVLSNPLKRAEYSALWTLEQAHSSPFNYKSLLESLAIAGISVLVGVLTQASIAAGVSLGDFKSGVNSTMSEIVQIPVISFEQISLLAATLVATKEGEIQQYP